MSDAVSPGRTIMSSRKRRMGWSPQRWRRARQRQDETLSASGSSCSGTLSEKQGTASPGGDQCRVGTVDRLRQAIAARRNGFVTTESPPCEASSSWPECYAAKQSHATPEPAPHLAADHVSGGVLWRGSRPRHLRPLRLAARGRGHRGSGAARRSRPPHCARVRRRLHPLRREHAPSRCGVPINRALPPAVVATRSGFRVAARGMRRRPARDRRGRGSPAVPLSFSRRPRAGFTRSGAESPSRLLHERMRPGRTARFSAAPEVPRDPPHCRARWRSCERGRHVRFGPPPSPGIAS